MYVLIDMEWVTNRHGNHWPTQLAAIRVDEEWQTVDSFSVLFRPKDITFQKWDHMAFSAAELIERLNAVAQAQKVSLNNLVCQCCEYALDNLSESEEDKE